MTDMANPRTPMLDPAETDEYEIIGEHLPRDGWWIDCPHSADWRREIRPPQPQTSDIRYIQCTACRYKQTLQRSTR